MAEVLTPDLCIIGAGSGGLTVAAGAAQMGARCVLIEKGAMGGDCLNTGCVPSKALLAAARAARAADTGAPFGVAGGPARVDFGRVRAHVAEVIAAIAPHDSVERFEGLGVTVVRAAARFVSPREVAAGACRIRARRFVVAVGSRPALPPVDGLDTVPFLTNETVFELETAPRHLIVIGGGPMGLEMAQAHRRLGAGVTVIEAMGLLSGDDPEAVDVLHRGLVAEGVRILEGASVARVAGEDADVRVTVDHAGGREDIAGSHLLVATGRSPATDGLGLDAAGVIRSAKGIVVDARLRTSNRRVFAIGDVIDGPRFTHAAGYQAGIVLRNALFSLPARTDYRAMPRVVYTDPELAHVGQTEDEARAAGGDIRVLKRSFAANDRARAERTEEGFLKAVVTPRGRVLGATIVGAHAGELILPWTLAVAGRIALRDLAQATVPYPTLSEVTRAAAAEFYAPRLFSAATRRLVRLLARCG